MKIAMLSPIAWRTPPRHYGPWERIVSLLTEKLVLMGMEVTLFATGDSETAAHLESVCPRGYEEDPLIDAKVWECLHIASCFEQADKFDLIHNHFDFLPLSFSRLVKTPIISTIHGFSSPRILAVYKEYSDRVGYVSISDADRSEELPYLGTVHHGIDVENLTYRDQATGNYLLFFGRFHPDKGAHEAIEIAIKSKKKLVMAGIIQDKDYFEKYVVPAINEGHVEYMGSVGPKERNDLMGGALALLHPINFNEPFGLSVVESMACGTPVIAFDKGSMPEIIDHGNNGFLVSTTEEAVSAVERIKELNRANCRAAVEAKFTDKLMAERYTDIYAKHLGNIRSLK